MTHFLFQNGEWIGEGTIAFNTSKDTIRFVVKWLVSENSNKEIECLQVVELLHVNEKVINKFILTNFESNRFKITLDNSVNDLIEGKGLFDDKKIAWEFQGNKDLEGFEIFELQETGEYIFRAEYASIEEFRTIVNGRIWKRSME